MKTVLHISRMNFLSNKAHVYTTAKTCEALATQENTNVILLSSDNSLITDSAKEDFFIKHGIKTRFTIVSLRSFSNYLRNRKFRILNWLETLLVNISIAKYVLKNRAKFDILYFRDCSLVFPILCSKYLLHKPIFLELHAVLHKKHGQYVNNYFSRISDGLIAITYGLKDFYQKYNRNVIVAFCAAAEPELIDRVKESKDQLRIELGLPFDKVILMYSGNLSRTGNNDSYGIEDLVQAIACSKEDTIFVGIGKKGNETKEHEELASRLNIKDRVLFLPWVGREKLYRYWRASDILVHPSAGAQIGNSPTKIFEYLASGKPIISADTPAIREVLHNNLNAILVSNYQDPSSWKEAVEKILTDQTLSNRLVSQALTDSKMYTWRGRGASISDFINQITAQNNA